MLPPRLIPALLTLTLLPLTGCDETDLIALRIRLNGDLSGLVTSSHMALPETPSAIEGAARGVEWNARAHIAWTSGEFAHLSQLVIADLTFDAGNTPNGLSFMRLTLPRGPEAQWPRSFVPTDESDRARAAETFDPSGDLEDVGKTIKIEIQVPREVISHGFSRARRVKEEVEDNVATLIVPVATALRSGPDITWHLTW